jgi:MFS family permease
MAATVTAPDARRRDGVALWGGLALCMAVGPLMLYTLTAVSPLVIDDLGLTPGQYGAIATVTFGAAAIGALVLGGPTGRWRPRSVMVGVALGSGLGLALLAGARSFALVLVAAVICGVAQSLSNPATNRVIAGLPPERRGALVGWKQSGVQMSQLVAGIAAPSIAVAAGWRWAVAAGLVMVVVAVAAALALRESAAPAPTVTGGERQRAASVGTLTAYTFFMGFGLQATNAYLPLFAHQRLGFDARTAGLTAAVVGLVGVASRIWWGRSSDRAGLRAWTLLTLALGSATGVLLAVSAAFAGGWLVWIGAGVFGAAALASNSVTMVALVRRVPPDALGAATGLLVTGMYLGFASGPLAFGLALDHGVSFGPAWLLPLAAFGIAALIGLPSALTRSSHNS